MEFRLDPLWVEDPEGVRRAAAACSAVGRFALDTEADSLHSYHHKVCLIQVSADDRHWLVDPLAVAAEGLSPLWKVIEDNRVDVVMHGADYDLRVLDRDFGVRIRRLEDTQVMAQLLGEDKTGLASLLETNFGVRLDKRHQRADWGRRPLSRDQLAYAASDTAHLDRLAALLRSRLEKLGRWRWAKQEFRKLEQVRFDPPDDDPSAFERIKGSKALRGADRDRLCALYRWREGEAERRDLPPFKVLGNRQLLMIAERAPSDLSDLAEIEGLGPRFARRWGQSVLKVLAKPGPAPARRRRQSQPRPTAEVRRRLRRLIEVRDAAATKLGLAPGLLAPRAIVQAVAEHPPAAGGPAAAGLEGWRLELLGDEFSKVLREEP